MALKIYEFATPTSAFSAGGVMTNPIRHAVDGRTGSIIEKCYYVRNDDAAFDYSLISVQPVSVSGENIVNGSNGFKYKVFAGTGQPPEYDWNLVEAGASASFSSGLINTTTYLPFWLRIEVPRGAEVTSHDGATLRLSATQGPHV